MADVEQIQESSLRKELGVWDLVLAQVLCVVGSTWVGIAAKLGRAHVVFWLASMAVFYVPLAVVVIYLNRLMPLEGGLYQWAKAGFGDLAGFLTAFNLWVYAVIVMGAILFVIPTDLSYMLGPPGAWIPGSHLATSVLTGIVLLAIVLVAIRGLDLGKWLHNVTSVMVLLAYVILLGLPIWALARGSIAHYEPIPWQWPKLDLVSLAIFGQITVGGLSGFEYVAIMAGECRSASRTIAQSVVISAPIIALMFILGTSSVLTFVGNQPINVIGPIPQTMRIAMGPTAAPFGILLLLGRAIGSASLIFTGLTRLPMTAGWDRLVPEWFTRLHPRFRTPVNSILFVCGVSMVLIALSMTGVGEQEASQLLANSSSALYGIAYVALFAIPWLGDRKLRDALPRWVKSVSVCGFFASLVSVFLTVYPIVDVGNKAVYAAKIASVVILANIGGVLLYRSGRRAGARGASSQS